MAPFNDHWSAGSKLAFTDIEMSNAKDVWENEQPHEVPAYHKRRTAGLWTALATLTVALAVVAIYGYSVISKDEAQLAMLPGLTKSFSAMRGRVNGVETHLQAWRKGQEDLAVKLQRMDTAWESQLSAARVQAASLVGSAYRKQQVELNQRTAILGAQIERMVSQERAQQARMVQLEQELVHTRAELASARENYAREMAALRAQQASDQQQIGSINTLLSTDQVNFQIGRKQREEIIPGVTLHLTKTDTHHQRFEGWISLVANTRTIWVRDQAVERPVVFYPKPDSDAYELVISRVNQGGATGYLLVPRDAETQQASLPVAKSADHTSSGVSSF